ncbi:MAG: cupin domain-containing protein [Dehalococcoidia bacterium]|nr:MAG: cupin domain-containing protein [Dehalococcoidia bacterium]
MNETNDINIYPKEWGSEHWIVNLDYCGKKLVLHRGYRCSIHYHKIKEETFYVIKGLVYMEINGQHRVLFPGDKQHIAVGETHRFTGLEDSEMIEFSTHHREDDSYREAPSGKVPDAEFQLLIRTAVKIPEQRHSLDR